MELTGSPGKDALLPEAWSAGEVVLTTCTFCWEIFEFGNLGHEGGRAVARWPSWSGF